MNLSVRSQRSVMSLIACLVSFTGITVTHRIEDERRFGNVHDYCHMVTIYYVRPAVWGVCNVLRERERESRLRMRERKTECAHMEISDFHGVLGKCHHYCLLKMRRERIKGRI